jgi:serine/threonine protein kinase
MGPSVEHVCNLLARSKLLSAEEIRGLHQRWRSEAARSADDVAAFSKWLVARQYVTEYQSNLLLRGKVDHIFLGPYKILERVGKGRMAGVYKAVHTLGQVVAVKVLPPSKARDPQLLARFQREARLALRLKHPNVVRTFQTGVFDGLHYMVMEYLDGETLEEVLQRRGRLPVAEAVRLLHQALLGLQHLHELGLVHRDLKPANLMLVPAAAPGDSTLGATVKVMDIGLGRALFEDEAGEKPADFGLTNEGALLGTPDYLAPEQARDARTADIRADIYSLGCVLYHALAGQPPFADNNLLRQLMRHATEPPRPLHQVNPAVPEGLAQIVGWMMAKDPAQRYPTPERAAAALQVFLSAGGDASAGSSPQLKAYLAWLDSQPGEEEASVAAPPARPAPPPPRPVPRPARPARAVAEVPTAELAEDPLADVDVELVPAAPARKAMDRRGEPDDEEAEAPAKQGLGRRDFIMLAVGAGAGAGALLALEAFVYFLVRLFRRKEDDSLPPPPPEPD